MMRVLALTPTQRLPDLSCFYQALGQHVSLDLRRLESDQQKDLFRILREVDLQNYDRILIDLPFRHIHRQVRYLRKLPGLILYEEDACQNYIASSRWRGAFSRFYAELPHACIVVTGGQVCLRLQEEGHNVHFLAKGYDPQRLFADAGSRDIELGFIGRTSSSAYDRRRDFLEQLAACEPLKCLRTEPGEPYRQALNRIRYFVSADVGLGEYMAKNFEAMACGCLVLAWRQGLDEDLIGLKDGDNLLLYSSLEELRRHLVELRADPAGARRIAEAGRALAESRLGYPSMAAGMAELIVASPSAPLMPEVKGRWSFLRHLPGLR
jgi:hypothetical protein